MKIAITGATRGIGLAMAQASLEDGHEVTVLARVLEKMPISHESLRIVAGDAQNPNAITKVVKARNITVIAFNPGLTGGVGGGDASALQKAIFKIITRTIYPLIGLFRPEFVMNTPEHSGMMLADVALGTISPPPGQVYVSLVKGKPTFPAPSELARDPESQDRLWHESAAMVGIEL